MPECIHGLDSEHCTICLHGITPRETVRVVAQSRTEFDNTFPCPGCDLPIYAGEFIVKLSNGGYVHSGCRP